MSESLEHELYRRASYLFQRAKTLGQVNNDVYPAAYVSREIAIQQWGSCLAIWSRGRIIYRVEEGRRSVVQDRDLCLEVVRLFRQMMILDDLANV